jgi:hypothetical protein
MLAFDLITLSVKGRVPKPNRLLPFLFTSHIQNITNVCLRMSSAITISRTEISGRSFGGENFLLVGWSELLHQVSVYNGPIPKQCFVKTKLSTISAGKGEKSQAQFHESKKQAFSQSPFDLGQSALGILTCRADLLAPCFCDDGWTQLHTICSAAAGHKTCFLRLM